jgi:hypothetical protein
MGVTLQCFLITIENTPWQHHLTQGVGLVIPAGLDLRGFLLGKHRAQRRSDHALMGFGDALVQVAGKVHAAALPAAAALQHLPDRVGDALVGVADHELDLAEAELFQ